MTEATDTSFRRRGSRWRAVLSFLAAALLLLLTLLFFVSLFQGRDELFYRSLQERWGIKVANPWQRETRELRERLPSGGKELRPASDHTRQERVRFRKPQWESPSP